MSKDSNEEVEPVTPMERFSVVKKADLETA